MPSRHSNASSPLLSFEHSSVCACKVMHTLHCHEKKYTYVSVRIKDSCRPTHESQCDCFERARRDLIVDLVNDLSDATLMILRAVTTAKIDFAKGVYGRYRQYCVEHGEKPFSYMHFYSHLSYLQSVGLVALVSTKTGRAYTNRVLPTFDPDVVGQIYRLRFGV